MKPVHDYMTKTISTHLAIALPLEYAGRGEANLLGTRLEHQARVTNVIVASDEHGNPWVSFCAAACDPMATPSFAAAYVRGLVEALNKEYSASEADDEFGGFDPVDILSRGER